MRYTTYIRRATLAIILLSAPNVQSGPGNSRIENGEKKITLICDEGTVSIDVASNVKVTGSMTKDVSEAFFKREPIPSLKSTHPSVERAEATFKNTLSLGNAVSSSTASTGYAYTIFGGPFDWTKFSCGKDQVIVKPSPQAECHFLFSC